MKTGRPGGTPTPPPYKVAGPTQPPPSRPPAATPTAPAATPAPVAPLPPDQATVQAQKTGQEVPILNGGGQVAKPDGTVGNPTPGAPAAPAAPTAPPPDVSPVPGVPSWDKYQKDNPIVLSETERALISRNLSPEAQGRFDAAMTELNQAEKIARERYARGEQGAGDAIEKAREAKAKLQEELGKAQRDAEKEGNTREAGLIKEAKDRLNQQYQELLKGGELRLTADNAVTNARKTKVLEGVDADVAQTGDRIGSLEALRVLSKQVG